MSDYLVWAGEKMEKRYGLDVYFWMNWIMEGCKIPNDLTLESYLKEEGING